MKKYRIRRKLKNKLLLKILIIISISVLFGILYMAIISSNDKKIVIDTIKTYFSSLSKIDYSSAFIKCLSSNILCILLIWLLGISIIGIPIIILVLIIKSFILGFSISSIIYMYKFKGILIAFFYIIPLLLNLFSITYISYYAITFSKNLNKLLFTKKDISFRNIMKKYIKIMIISIIFILISSILEIYVIPLILKLFKY